MRRSMTPRQALADADHEAGGGVAVDAGEALDGSEAVALDKQVQDRHALSPA